MSPVPALIAHKPRIIGDRYSASAKKKQKTKIDNYREYKRMTYYLIIGVILTGLAEFVSRITYLTIFAIGMRFTMF